jgi:hypothetical protein
MVRSLAASTSALLSHYSFDLGEHPLNQLVENWLGEYPPRWVMGAIIEALYQGRYKASSVERILFLWYLRGQPLHHFDFEFLDIICSGIFQVVPISPGLLGKVDKKPPATNKSQEPSSQKTKMHFRDNLEQLAA